MDDRRFDVFVRMLASGHSRRQFVKGLFGFGSATVAGVAVGQGTSEAARRPVSTPTPVPTCPGSQTWNGSACVCQSGVPCGPDCCDGSAQCCDNACCYGTCYGEE